MRAGDARASVPGMRKSNFAGRAGRWSATHRRAAILGWIAFVIAAVVLGGAAGVNHQRNEDLGSGQSGHADRLIAAGFAQHASEQVLVQGRGAVTVDDPRFRAALDTLETRLRGLPHSADLGSPLAHGANLVSPDRRSALLQFGVMGDSNAA